jgi:hypothetical protein
MWVDCDAFVSDRRRRDIGPTPPIAQRARCSLFALLNLADSGKNPCFNLRRRNPRNRSSIGLVALEERLLSTRKRHSKAKHAATNSPDAFPDEGFRVSRTCTSRRLFRPRLTLTGGCLMILRSENRGRQFALLQI